MEIDRWWYKDRAARRADGQRDSVSIDKQSTVERHRQYREVSSTSSTVSSGRRLHAQWKQWRAASNALPMPPRISKCTHKSSARGCSTNRVHMVVHKSSVHGCTTHLWRSSRQVSCSSWTTRQARIVLPYPVNPSVIGLPYPTTPNYYPVTSLTLSPSVLQ